MWHRWTVRALTPVLLACCAAVSAAADTDAYTKRDTWQETLRLTLERQNQAATPLPAGFTAGPQGVLLGTWQLAGPFAAAAKVGFNTRFPPLQAMDAKQSLSGKGWSPRPALEDGVVHMMRAPGNQATFLARELKAPQAVTITGYFGSDDALGVWLNGEVVVAQDVKRGPAPNQDRADLKLKAGDNVLLLMIYNYTGDHGFYFSTQATPGSPRQDRLASVWARLATDFPGEDAQREMAWEQADGLWTSDWPPGDVAALAARCAAATHLPTFAEPAAAQAPKAKTEADLNGVRQLYYRAKWAESLDKVQQEVQFAGLRLAVADLARRFPDTYAGKDYLARIDELEKQLARVGDAVSRRDAQGMAALPELKRACDVLRREALLANPLLDFDRVLFIKRKGGEGLPQNWQGNDPLHGNGFDNQIASFSLRDPAAPDQSVYKPEQPIFVGDVDLHTDGERMLFSTNGTVCEVRRDGSGFRKVVTEMESYDPCYLPDGRILFISNSPGHAVPCVGGADYVGNLHVANADGTGIRRLTFDQDNNWNPVMLENGRVLYSRWEYTDSAHYFARILMHMNPDGTNQAEFLGSNSYWPNSIFYARQIPGFPTRVVAIVSGHHGPARMGELVLFDAARGRFEASGAIQKIPGYGKPVEAVTMDNLVGAVWPKFLHPFPLSDAHFLVACRPTPADAWGIYLVDTFDNRVPLRTIPGVHCLEPVPLRATHPAPILPERVRLDQKEATVYIQDNQVGRGLRNLPRGLAKSLRVYEYVYAYRNTGGHNVVGYEGPWDVRRILGTVPVEADGSALFRIPANTPVAVQPLDAEGKALALMRSWFVGMPGEVVSCIGCHEEQSTVPTAGAPSASRQAARAIRPWYGPGRGFSFQREIQPVLDRYCVGCHSGKRADLPCYVDDGKWVSFNTAQSRYSKSYLALIRYVRRNGPEGDYHPLTPLEFHADTSELIQKLQKGHHNVRLDAEALDRLITWVDLNVPFHGTWTEAAPGIKGELVAARRAASLKYAGVDVDIEEVTNPYKGGAEFVKPAPEGAAPVPVGQAAGWPFDATTAKARQGSEAPLTMDLGNGQALSLVRIPAGAFMMGSTDGDGDERPLHAVTVGKPFWLGRCEVTNEQYAGFDPEHDSGVYDMRWKDQTRRGYFVNQPGLPVIRVSWGRAMEFCRWLSQKTGKRVSLPTEAQWEWACRAGSDTPLAFGPLDRDFGRLANLADVTTKQLVVMGVDPQPVDDPPAYACYLPAVFSVDDKTLHLAPPGTYEPNAWGLVDMHGNVAEWTRSQYRPYPYREDDGRNDETDALGKRVVRGGSWNDRPARARSAFRLAYPAWQQVFNVGFRVVVED